jgi:hypothetical protein
MKMRPHQHPGQRIRYLPNIFPIQIQEPFMIGLVVKYGTAVDATVVNVVVATWRERESGHEV